jgi:hypothetical protein
MQASGVFYQNSAFGLIPADNHLPEHAFFGSNEAFSDFF